MVWIKIVFEDDSDVKEVVLVRKCSPFINKRKVKI